MATPTAVPILGALNTNSPSDDSVPMNLSSDFEVESELDIESNITPLAGEVFSVDSHVWKTKVRAVQQRNQGAFEDEQSVYQEHPSAECKGKE